MNDKTYNISELKKYFSNRDIFEIQDLYTFYKIFNSELSLNAVRIRVSRLIKAGVLNKHGQGCYSFSKKQFYIPEVTNKLITINRKLIRNFPLLKFCIWRTSSVNEFMLHQPFRFYIIIETESEAVESVFNFLQNDFNNVFIRPDGDILYNYATSKSDCLIIRNLVSEAPLQAVGKLTTITIEKMLVDIFIDHDLFITYQGHELLIIFQGAFKKYIVSQKRLLRYAYRRGKKNEILSYINNIGNIWQ